MDEHIDNKVETKLKYDILNERMKEPTNKPNQCLIRLLILYCDCSVNQEYQKTATHKGTCKIL